MSEQKNLGGRPSKYKPEYAEQAERLSQVGLTDQEMADYFKVCKQTFYTWQREYPEFLDSLKFNKEACDKRVERSLYHKAMGTTVTETKTEIADDGTTKTVTTVKEIPPSDTSMIFWLKNRQPKKWRDRVEQSVEVQQSVMPVPTADSVDDWEEVAKGQQSEVLSNDG